MAIKALESAFHENDFKLVEFNGKWGYIDPDQNLVIEFLYDDAYPFSEGLASTSINGKKGFINKRGECIIDFHYDSATFFKEGKAKVTKQGKEFFINQLGEIL